MNRLTILLLLLLDVVPGMAPQALADAPPSDPVPVLQAITDAEPGKAPAPAAVTAVGKEPGLGDLVRTLFSFMAVIVLLFVCAWFLKRWQPGLAPGQGGMQIRGVLPLGGRDRVVVVQVGERQLLLGVSPGRVVRLGEYENLLAPEEPAADAGARFRQLLQRR